MAGGWRPRRKGWRIAAGCVTVVVNLLGGGGEPGYAGIAELYYQFEDGQEYQRVYSGYWRMVDDCLQLNVSTGVGNSPSDASGIFPCPARPVRGLPAYLAGQR